MSPVHITLLVVGALAMLASLVLIFFDAVCGSLKSEKKMVIALSLYSFGVVLYALASGFEPNDTQPVQIVITPIY